MDRIEDLEAFVAIVQKGGQSAAARALHRSLQSVNRSLATLEKGVGIALIKRTTRRSVPTEAGLVYYARLKPALDEIRQARAEAADRGRALSGVLRVGAPVSFAQAFVVPVMCELMARFPRMEFELKASDRPADLLDEKLDVAVRVRHLADSSLKARRLGDLRIGVFAATRYLDRHGRPQHPSELSRHACVPRTLDGQAEPWPFRIDGRTQNVAVRGRLRCNDASVLHDAVARGLGLGFGPLWQVQDRLDRGELEVVLEAYEIERMPVHAVLPPTRTQPVKVRLFVDLLAARVGAARL